MSMNFTVTATGTVTLRGIDVSDLNVDAGDLFSDNTNGDISVDTAYIESASVDIRADVSLSDIEVAAADLINFDAEQAIEEALTHWDSSIMNADFEVTASPTGFEEVKDATDRDTAIAVYAALANAGFEVS